MDTKFITLSEILEIYTDEVQATFSEEQAQRVLNETRSAIYRFLLPQLGFQKTSSGRKMTSADIQAAAEFTQTVTVLRLRQARGLIAKAFDQAEVSVTSRNTYGGRLNQFLSWVETQSWYPSDRRLKIQNQCRSPRQITGRRRVQDLRLTAREGAYLQYRLKPEETPIALQETLDDLDRFIVAPHYPGRVRQRISERTRDTYLKDIRLMLGYCLRHQPHPIPLAELSLTHLVPLVTRQDLQGLSDLEREDLWRSQELALESWITNYFDFIREKNHSSSPRTQMGKLLALQRVGYYLYRGQVRRNQDYNTIPILNAINEKINEVVQVKKKWDRNRTYVANQTGKWIDPVPGETALTTLRREVLEPMRIACRPRRKNGVFCDPPVIARDLLHYLKWMLVLDLPPRRQRDYRTLEISLVCPLQKPADVPADGFCFPLPPAEERKKNYDGTLADNFLYKVYSDQGVSYPGGLWILELRSFKTEDTYGTYSMRIPDRPFDDGTTLYEHLEHYLCGWWISGGRKQQQTYDWWDPAAQGKRGRWVTKGRQEFEPKDDSANGHRRASSSWRSGYLFPVPTTGLPADASSFGGSFKRSSHKLVGKNITPHILRAVWATWAFQVGLSDAELRSLAFAMGHSVETLRGLYERCTPEEKLRPIFEAMERNLFQQWQSIEPAEQSEERSPQQSLATLVQEINQLSATDRQELFNLFG